MDASLRHLLGQLDVLLVRVAHAVDVFRGQDPEPDDRFRGLYLADHHVDDLLTRSPARLVMAARCDDVDPLRQEVERDADDAETNGAELRLRQLARTARLSQLDVDLLTAALAPDVDPRFERFYGYLQDDVTRRRASTLLALALAGCEPTDGQARGRLHSGAALRRHALVRLENTDDPFLARALRVPDRVTTHLLGDDQPDESLAPMLLETDPSIDDVAEATTALASSAAFVYLREARGGRGPDGAAASARAALGTEPVVIDLDRLTRRDYTAVIEGAIREATIRGAVLVAWPLEAVADQPLVLEHLAQAPVPRVLVGKRTWDPAWSETVPLVVDEPMPTAQHRVAWWHTDLGQTGLDVAATTAPYRLSARQVRAASIAAHERAERAGRPVSPEDLQHGARTQNAAGLDRLARRIRPAASWGDLVLPSDVRGELEELVARSRHRDRVLGWGVGGPKRTRGITALFAGESGTGKTLSAEVVAGELGLDMYVIDLSTVIDKYIGETEKNLERIFVEAEQVNGVLLFDEADALFGKRSEVRDSHDRHANVEVAYLLQRMELFEGLAILTTNVRANVDDAFTRRLDVILDFPEPDVTQRRALWALYLNHGLPTRNDIDVDFLSDRFRLTGGNISNVVTAAAYLAAGQDTDVGMEQVIRAIEREYRKLGRLTHESEFGDWHDVLIDPPRVRKEAAT